MSKTVRAAPAMTSLPVKPAEKASRPQLSRLDAGDVSEESDNPSSYNSAINRGDNISQKFPVNIHRRLNALRNLHMSTRKKEQDLQVAIFKLEAEHYKSLESILKKRNDIITGKYEPTEEESKFALSEKDVPAETAPDDGQSGVPKFWLVVLSYAAHTADLIQQHDVQVLEYLKDIRVEYQTGPMGFTLIFEFLPNPFFANSMLTRSFEYDINLSAAQLYQSSGLMPTNTKGCEVKWKDGKDIMARNTGNSKKKLDSFFNFFSPSITDLSKIGQLLTEGEDEEFFEKAEQAGIDYEVATALRGRIVPRALLFYTGEADNEGIDDSDYSEDYSEESTAAGQLREADEDEMDSNGVNS